MHAGPSKWTDDEARAFVQAMQAERIDPVQIASFLTYESGLSPGAYNKGGDAQGLGQITPIARKAIGYSGPPLQTLTIAEQSPWIAKLIRMNRNATHVEPTTVEKAWHMHMWPASVATDIVVRRDVPAERAGYDGNKQLDTNGDGIIDEADLSRALSPVVSRYAGTIAQIARLAQESRS